MTTPVTWSPPQQLRLDQWGVERSVDVHCHCLPGVDDGPATPAESLRLCTTLVADGVTTVFATPHQLGGYDRVNTAAAVRTAVAELNASLADAAVPLEVLPGGDVRVDERLGRLLEQDEVLTCGDLGKHLLLELPHEVFVDPLPAIKALAARGVQVIMTHPERHRYLVGAVDRIASWVDAGAVLQVTAGSIVGEFGSTARQECWRLIDAGLVSLVASDAHGAFRRPPRLTAALDELARHVSPAAAHALCLANPLRVLHGEPLVAFGVE